MPGVPEAQDPAIADLLGAGDDREKREAGLRALLHERVATFTERLLDAEVGRGVVTRPEAEDVREDVLLRLLRKLRQVLAEPRVHAIANLDDYVTATVYNALDDLRRQRDPLRSRLSRRLRYVLTHSPRFGMWGEDPPLCGLAAWTGRSDVVPVVLPRGVSGAMEEDADRLRDAVEEVLEASGAPVLFGALAEAFAASMGLSREPFVGMDALESSGEPPDTLPRLLAREYLERLWCEIVLLPVEQRQALLLHLRLEDGESAARVLAALGIAALPALAEAVALPLSDLLALWNELPLADERIARRLGVSRQRVINLRKSARARLARRTARWRSGGGES